MPLFCAVKLCQTCKLPNKTYGKSRREKDGLNRICKDCAKAFRDKSAQRNRARARQWYAENKARAQERMAEWRASHREETRALNAEQYARNRARRIALAAAWKRANAEKVRTYRERGRATTAAWKARNKALLRTHDRMKRARKRSAPGEHCAADIDALLKAQRGKCPVCSKALGRRYHVDHIVALSRGGSNGKENIQLLCPDCNMQKHCKDPISFMQSKGFLL